MSDIQRAEDDEEPTDRHDLDRPIGKLGDRQRDLVRSLSVEGRSAPETASRLDMSEGAVRSRRIARSSGSGLSVFHGNTERL